MLESKLEGKSYDIPKPLLWDAWLKVKAKGGSAGADGVTIEQFEEDVKNRLFVLWNRMSSGSYFPGPIRAVDIPKKKGSRRLGIPNIVDRIAQTAAAMALEPSVEQVFHDDSYGYRPGRSPLEAVAVCRDRCFKKGWVLDLDIRKFFDSVPWNLTLKALARHTDQKWVLLYVERWLKAPMLMTDGSLVPREKGTPQGSPISPLIANLFLHVCPERRVKRCRRSFCEPGCASDGGRSSGFAVQAGSPNRRGVMPVKSRGGKRLRNGSLSAGQVCDEKTNMVEPLLTHRKTIGSIATGVGASPWESIMLLAWCSWRTACVSLWWCSVLRWRELVVGAGMEQENLCLDTAGQVRMGAGCPLAARGRTLGGRNRRGQSTARRRGGPARSSVEGPVMGLERRGRAGQLTRMPTRLSGRN